MKTIVVDDTYAGLVKKDYWYELNGDLVSEGNIEIKLDMDLRVSGSIQAVRYITTVGDIQAGRGITAGEYITAGGDIQAGRDIRADGDIKAGGDIQAVGDIECSKLVSGTVKSGTLIESGK